MCPYSNKGGGSYGYGYGYILGPREHTGSGAAAVRWRRARHDNLCAIQLIELQELMNYVGRLDAQSATLFAAR